MILKMDRDTFVDKMILSAGLGYLVYFIIVNNTNPSVSEYKQYSYHLASFVALATFFILVSAPFTKIVFNVEQNYIQYYRFCLFKKRLPLTSIIKAVSQTRTQRRYSKGKSTTFYTTDVYVVTDVNDFQIRVFQMAKAEEFKTKLQLALSQLKTKNIK